MHARRLLSILVAVAATTLSSLASAQAPPARPPAPRSAQESAAARELWNPANSLFIRSWAVRPLGGSPVTEAPDDRAGWQQVRSWSNIVDLGPAAGQSGDADAPRFAVAAAEIRRASRGKAFLSVHLPGPASFWLNGKLLYRMDPPPGAVYPHAAEVPLELVEGTNLLAVQVENRGGPWRLQAAILEPGQDPPAPDQLIERLVATAGSLDLILRDGITGPARVDVLGPGGRVIAATTSGPRGSITFDQRAWPDGPYEIRVRGADAFGASLMSFLPWTKGDSAAIAAAARERAREKGADESRWRLIETLLDSRPDDAEALHAVAFEAAELSLGAAAAIRPSGFLRLAWTDEVDGSDQFCRAYLPAEYTPDRAWPTILNLHGFNPENPPYSRSWSVTQRHHPAAGRYGVIWIEPHGRGNAQYIGIGERDVMRCLAEARRLVAVDPERIYLTGESMGGSGTWLIGSRNPAVFAALAPIFGGWDFRLHPHGPFSSPGADRPMEQWLAEAHSSFASAEQLLNTPVLVQHGDADAAVDVAFSRHIVRLLQRWNYDVRYLEHPGAGHEDLGSLDLVVPWLLKHRLDPQPRRVRVRSVDLAGARTAWLDITLAEKPLTMIEADAEVLAPGRVRIYTRNVGQLRLRLPAALRSPEGSIAVTWNGVESLHRPPVGEALVLTDHAPPAGAVKNAERPGGLSDVFATPFAVVVGTISSDRAMTAQLRAKAEEFAQLWQGWQHVRPRVLTDVELTDRDAARYSLVLLGGPEANAVTRRLASKLRFAVAPDRVVIDGRDFPVRDAVVQLVRPSPLNSLRYVMVVAGTSAEGMWLWNPGQYWRQVMGYPTNFYDWIIADSRMPTLVPGLLEERGWVASGVFDTRWQRTDALTFLGDAAARASAPVRRMADRGLDLPAEQIARLAGTYSLEGTPAVLEVRGSGNHLQLMAQGVPAAQLLARSADRFVTRDLRTTLRFSNEPSSCVLTLESAGERTIWRRIGAADLGC